MKEIFKKLVVTFTVGALVLSGSLTVLPKAQAEESNVDSEVVWEDTYDTNPNAPERYASDMYNAEYIELQSKINYERSMNPTYVGEQPEITPYGVKSKALVKVAQLLKAGGDEVIDAARAFNIIDAATARTFKSNSKKIGNFITKFENYGDEAANAVRKQLPQWFKDNTRVSKGVAENISIAVSWAIRGADWLFF